MPELSCSFAGSVRFDSIELEKQGNSTHKEKEEREKTARDIYECKQEVNMSVFIIIFMGFL